MTKSSLNYAIPKFDTLKYQTLLLCAFAPLREINHPPIIQRHQAKLVNKTTNETSEMAIFP